MASIRPSVPASRSGSRLRSHPGSDVGANAPRGTSAGRTRLRAAALLVAFAGLGAAFGPRVQAAPLDSLGGTLHGPDQTGLFSIAVQPPRLLGLGAPIGSFDLYAETDLRLDPRAAALSTDTGDWLVALTFATPQLLHPPRRDPESGRALRADAPDGAVCPTGEEPGCWREGDPPLPGQFLAAALCAALGIAPESCSLTDLPRRAPVADVTALAGLGDGGTAGSEGIELRNAEAGVLLQGFPGIPGIPAGFDPVPPGAISPANSARIVGLPLISPIADATGSLQIPEGGVSFNLGASFGSFNLAALLQVLSQPQPDDPDSVVATDPPDLGAFDPNHPFAFFDPSDPGSISFEGQCSFLQPQFCSSVQIFFEQGARLEPLPDDPFAGDHERWIWEAGAEYEITAAGGAFGRFEGGRLFALGPERARVVSRELGDTPRAGMTFLLVADDPTETPMLFFAAPEPGAGALGSAALAALAALSPRRRSSRPRS